jgi:hypothetical protein
MLRIIACLCLLSSSLLAQKRFLVGRVLDASNKQGIDGASVVNQQTKQVARTNKEGKFFVWASKGDSILISSVSHGRAGIKWDGETRDPHLELNQQAIALDEVAITGKRSATLTREIKEFKQEPQATLGLSGEQVLDYAAEGAGISLLYEMFSKEAKSRRKAAVIRQEDRKKNLVNQRFNPQLVASLTKLKGKQLEDFMKYSQLDDDFVLNATDYELHRTIYYLFEQYKLMRRLP